MGSFTKGHIDLFPSDRPPAPPSRWLMANLCFVRQVSQDENGIKRTKKTQRTVADREKAKGRRRGHKMLHTLIGWKDEVSSLPCRMLLHYFVYILLAQAGYHRDGATLTMCRRKYERSKLGTSCDTAFILSQSVKTGLHRSGGAGAGSGRFRADRLAGGPSALRLKLRTERAANPRYSRPPISTSAPAEQRAHYDRSITSLSLSLFHFLRLSPSRHSSLEIALRVWPRGPQLSGF